MLRNYLIIAWRNLIRKKSFSIINIAGLSIGMAAATLILLWVRYELTYDQFFQDEDRIYQVFNRYDQDGKINCWAQTPGPMSKAIEADYPEVEYAVRVDFQSPVQFVYKEKKISVIGNLVDSNFLQVFDFPLLSGRAAIVLNNPYGMVLTESFSKRLFGEEDPIGKTVRVDNRDNFTITGVLKDKPKNTRFGFEFLLPTAYLRANGDNNQNWGNNYTATYVKLKPGASLASLAPKLKTLRKKYDKDDPKIETFLYPFSRLYLHGIFENGKESTGGRIEIVRLFMIIAGFILLIACINFMNLSTARSEKRAKEVGIRKVIGAQRGSLITQFLGESILFTLIAGLLSLLLVELFLPAFSRLVDKQLQVEYSSVGFWSGAAAFVIATGLLAGSYPALFLSSFKPVSVMKGALKTINPLISTRKILVVGQFTFAIVLIIATIVVRQQIEKAQSRESGYAKDHLIYHFMEGEVEKNYSMIKRELLASRAAVSVTKTSAPVTEGWSNSWAISWPGKDPKDKTVINRFVADDAVVKTMGFTLVAGRDLSLQEFITDSNAAVINETAAKLMGFKNPIAQTINDMGQQWHVVGVIKDFILNSPFQPLEPIFIAGAKGWFNVIHIKLNDQFSTQKNIAAIEAIFKKYNPGYTLNYHFADSEYAKKFDDQRRTGTLATLFAILTISISCLGLFGLSSYMAESRTKEIGVRKVLGASVAEITRLLSKDFLVLVLIAFVIAAPMGYWAMETWLKNFPYRISISWTVFALAGAAAMFIALATVSFQAVKAGLLNPVKALRTE